jgi:hypothetical protein
LIATGIGIAIHLPYTKELLRKYLAEKRFLEDKNLPVRHHRISLIWELENESKSSLPARARNRADFKIGDEK